MIVWAGFKPARNRNNDQTENRNIGKQIRLIELTLL